MSDDQYRDEPTDEEVAAIVAVLFDTPEPALEVSRGMPAWKRAALRDGIARWPRLQRVSRLELEDLDR